MNKYLNLLFGAAFVCLGFGCTHLRYDYYEPKGLAEVMSNFSGAKNDGPIAYAMVRGTCQNWFFWARYVAPPGQFVNARIRRSGRVGIGSSARLGCSRAGYS